MPDETDLLRRLIGVLSFAADALTKLDRYAAQWEEEKGAFLRRQDKVAAEAILLAYLASRVPREDERLRGVVETLSDRAWVHIATGRNEALLRRFPQTATTLGVGYVLLSALGRGQPLIESLLRRAIVGGFATLSERGPFRLMDTRWTYGLLDERLVRPVDELLPFSTLAASPHPIDTMNEDDYALTHALFYVTDFGRRPPPDGLPVGGDELLAPFLAWNAVREDLDLLGEFLIAALALGRTHSPAFRFAWQLFFRAWDETGLVGPEYSPEQLARLVDEAAAAYAFRENYHTVFVGGILCAVALTAPPRPPAERPARSTTGGTLADRCSAAAARARGALGLAEADDGSPLPRSDDRLEWIVARLLQVFEVAPVPGPRWLRVAVASDLPRDELASVFYEALLVAAARQYRLTLLTEALAVGAEHAPLRSRTFARALEFLLDQQLADGFVGIHRLLGEGKDATGTREAQATIARLLARIAAALER